MRINVKGPIVPNGDKWIYDLFDMEATCPNDITAQLDESPNEQADVMINSGGGDVHSASEIYTALRNHAGGVRTNIVGIAASAASVIAMAGNKLAMSPTAEMMIHNSQTIALGDKNEMSKTFEMLSVTDRTIANAYRGKSGLDESELLELMDKETWLTAEDAKAHGLIDEIMFENDNVAKVASASAVSNMIPQQVINKLRDDKVLNDGKGSGDDDSNRIKGLEIDLKLGEIEGYEEFMNEMKEVKRYLVNSGLVDENGEPTDQQKQQNNTTQSKEPQADDNFKGFLF